MRSTYRIRICGRALLTCLAVACLPVVWGQATNVFPSSGSVGIGTTSPGRLLHLSAVGQPGLAFSDTTGTSGNKTTGFVYDGGSDIGGVGGLVFQDFTDGGGFAANRFTLWKDGSINFGGITRPTAVGQVVFTGGAVGIGTTHAGQCGAPGTNTLPCLLTVDGAIGTGEIVVTNGITADYVFDPGYRLTPLKEVAAYIQEHHHLPEIPSAADVKEKGVSLGEMQAKLLAKIEELTLHLIRAEERNRELQERVARLEAGGH